MLFMKKNFKIFSKEGAPARSKQLHNSKTTCFGVVKMPSNTVKDAYYNTKTSCFALVIYYPLFRNEDLSGSNPYKEWHSTDISYEQRKIP